ncbi:MAG: GDP-mannose 4,6-dehydratase [Bacilli bacterium]|nr:GDP-mannose 4,6-dehydratase [Bacilli bacterium]
MVERLFRETDYEIFVFENKLLEDQILLKSDGFPTYNFACPASPKYYVEHPIETWESSVLGVRNLLEAVKGSNTKLFHSSTSEVYGDALEIPQEETYWGNVNKILL